MGDLSQTAGSVLWISGNKRTLDAGASIVAGNLLYADAQGVWQKAATTSAITAAASAMALNTASTGQPVVAQTDGVVNPGATVAVGAVYACSDTAGAVALASDNGSGDFITTVGIGLTSSTMSLDFSRSGVAHA